MSGLRESFPGTDRWRGRHVVIANWRDGRHPQAGGAESYCERVARELHDAGVLVTFLTARPRGSARRERTPYGTVVRGGGRYTVYPFVLLWLLLHRRGVHGVVDSQNGIPFFAPLVVRRRTPVLLLIHHVHQQQFAVLPRPLAMLGRWLEAAGSRLVYGRGTVCAVSPSSRAEIRSQLGLRGPVYLAPPGLTPAAPGPRAARPRIVCVSRLARQKRLDRLIRAMPPLLRLQPGTELHIVGDGAARSELQRLVTEFGVGRAVVLHGRLPARARDALVASAWLTALPSSREGWGLSVMEAAALGVPAVAYDVPGLRDTVRPGRTGWLAEEDPPDVRGEEVGSGEDGACGREAPGQLVRALDQALRTLRDPDQYALFSGACREWSARFTWTATAAHLLSALTAERLRLRGDFGQQPVSDSCTVVTLPRELFDAADPSVLRPTDLAETGDSRAALLLTGADEQDARAALVRMGLDPYDDRIEVRLARHRDLLGWRAHPSAGDGRGRRGADRRVPKPRTRDHRAPDCTSADGRSAGARSALPRLAAAVPGMLPRPVVAARPVVAVAAFAGVLFALAVAAGEPYAVTGVLPVAVLSCRRAGGREQAVCLIAAVAAAYGVYVAVAAGGRTREPWGLWGPHQPAGVFPQFVIGCTVITLGTSTVLWLLWRCVRRPATEAALLAHRPAPDRRTPFLITAWCAGGLVHLCYAEARGAFEVRLCHPQLIAALACLALAAAHAVRGIHGDGPCATDATTPAARPTRTTRTTRTTTTGGSGGQLARARTGPGSPALSNRREEQAG
ncbi:glycosyltransferase family 4 protein [Streptomyces ovatisporus]|uniref:Glycosyltransferase family 4 protein n=1 Tax=Streptomyces ovatisporus TaxID=1128682 RepID=A0ABV9A618_9ACTN